MTPQPLSSVTGAGPQTAMPCSLGGHFSILPRPTPTAIPDPQHATNGLREARSGGVLSDHICACEERCMESRRCRETRVPLGTSSTGASLTGRTLLAYTPDFTPKLTLCARGHMEASVHGVPRVHRWESARSFNRPTGTHDDPGRRDEPPEAGSLPRAVNFYDQAEARQEFILLRTEQAGADRAGGLGATGLGPSSCELHSLESHAYTLPKALHCAPARRGPVQRHSPVPHHSPSLLPCLPATRPRSTTSGTPSFDPSYPPAFLQRCTRTPIQATPRSYPCFQHKKLHATPITSPFHAEPSRPFHSQHGAQSTCTSPRGTGPQTHWTPMQQAAPRTQPCCHIERATLTHPTPRAHLRQDTRRLKTIKPFLTWVFTLQVLCIAAMSCLSTAALTCGRQRNRVPTPGLPVPLGPHQHTNPMRSPRAAILPTPTRASCKTAHATQETTAELQEAAVAPVSVPFLVGFTLQVRNRIPRKFSYHFLESGAADKEPSLTEQGRGRGAQGTQAAREPPPQLPPLVRTDEAQGANEGVTPPQGWEQGQMECKGAMKGRPHLRDGTHRGGLMKGRPQLRDGTPQPLQVGEVQTECRGVIKGKPQLRDTTEGPAGTGKDRVQESNEGETPPHGRDTTEGPGRQRQSECRGAMKGRTHIKDTTEGPEGKGIDRVQGEIKGRHHLRDPTEHPGGIGTHRVRGWGMKCRPSRLGWEHTEGPRGTGTHRVSGATKGRHQLRDTKEGPGGTGTDRVQGGNEGETTTQGHHRGTRRDRDRVKGGNEGGPQLRDLTVCPGGTGTKRGGPTSGIGPHIGSRRDRVGLGDPTSGTPQRAQDGQGKAQCRGAKKGRPYLRDRTPQRAQEDRDRLSAGGDGTPQRVQEHLSLHGGRQAAQGMREPWQGLAHTNSAGASEANGAQLGCQAFKERVLISGQKPAPGCTGLVVPETQGWPGTGAAHQLHWLQEGRWEPGRRRSGLGAEGWEQHLEGTKEQGRLLGAQGAKKRLKVPKGQQHCWEGTRSCPEREGHLAAREKGPGAEPNEAGDCGRASTPGTKAQGGHRPGRQEVSRNMEQASRTCAGSRAGEAGRPAAPASPGKQVGRVAGLTPEFQEAGRRKSLCRSKDKSSPPPCMISKAHIIYKARNISMSLKHLRKPVITRSLSPIHSPIIFPSRHISPNPAFTETRVVSPSRPRSQRTSSHPTSCPRAAVRSGLQSSPRAPVISTKHGFPLSQRHLPGPRHLLEPPLQTRTSPLQAPHLFKPTSSKSHISSQVHGTPWTWCCVPSGIISRATVVSSATSWPTSDDKCLESRGSSLAPLTFPRNISPSPQQSPQVALVSPSPHPQGHMILPKPCNHVLGPHVPKTGTHDSKAPVHLPLAHIHFPKPKHLPSTKNSQPRIISRACVHCPQSRHNHESACFTQDPLISPSRP
ncbi:hypothetical protein Cadr_000021625 [Camelus dromedarius]|uniref:Uncharacterized protein n=1 Tax=Camelus dromedarius TaxID=9838 RepID=A0A5N4CT27_CAMDR|nr:hypothetical protein Cadr_000021625 [Camelus dromedarius]